MAPLCVAGSSLPASYYCPFELHSYFAGNVRSLGTRYKRRGVDTEGHVANYVETELVLQCGSHVVSYVIIRGSVPVYWSQSGNKYHPLPVIERSE